jgi:hypothetical protein
MILDKRVIMSNFMYYHLPHCIHCKDTLLSAPEKEDGYWFMRCLSCGARNILSQPPLPFFAPELTGELGFQGFIL